MKSGKILHIILAVLFAMFMGGHFLLNDRGIQESAAGHAVSIAQSALGTAVSADRVQFSYPFGITLDGLTLYDESGDTLISTGSATLRFKPMQLIRHRMSITSVRLQNPDIRLSADSAGARPNWAFLTELSDGDSTRRMSFRANSIIIRNGTVKYNLKSAAPTDSIFNPSHILVTSLNANLSLKKMDSDSLAFIVRKLEFAEQSGFRLTNARGGVSVSPDRTHTDGLYLETPSSRISVIGLTANRGLASSDSPLELSAEISSALTGSDFKAFCPELGSMTDLIVTNFAGSVSGRRIDMKRLATSAGNNTWVLSANGSILLSDSISQMYLKDFEMSGKTDSSLSDWIESQFAGFGVRVPRQLAAMGAGTFRAELDGGISDIRANIGASYDCGTVSALLEGTDGRYKACVTGDSVQLGRITGSRTLGDGSVKLDIDARRLDNGFEGEFQSGSATVTYNGYTYRGVIAQGSFSPESANAAVLFSDSNGSVRAHGGYSKGPDGPDICISVTADTVNLNRYMLSRTQDLTLSARLKARLHGNRPDDMTGRISIDSLQYSDSEGSWSMDKLTVSKGSIDGKNELISVYGDFLSLSMIGEYDISTLSGTLLETIDRFAPTVSEMLTSKMGLESIPDHSPNTFLFDARIDNTDFMEPVLHKPLKLEKPVTARCFIDETGDTFSAELTAPSFTFADKRIDGGHLRMESGGGDCFANVRGQLSGPDIGITDLNTTLTAREDSIDCRFSWSDAADSEFSGTLLAHSHLLDYDSRHGWLISHNVIDTTAITLRDAVWNLSRTTVETDSGKIAVNGFCLGNGIQHFTADGTVSADSSDVLNISLHQIDLDRTLTMLHANKAGFRGTASGQMSIAGILSNPAFYGTIQASDFGFMDSYHGDLTADCSWNRALRRVDIIATANEGGRATSDISGYFQPENKYVDFNIIAGHTDLHFLNTWTKSVFSELDGRAVGNLRLFGPANNLDLEGKACLENGRFVLQSIGSTFIVKHDTLLFEPGRMVFQDIGFYDESDHDGIMTCILNHDHFHDWKVGMTADFTDMQVFSMPRGEQGSIYATLRAEGSMALQQDNKNGLSIQADVRTSPGTRLGYSSASSVQDNSFLTIVDRCGIETDGRLNDSISASATVKKRTSPLNLDFNVECTDDAVIDVDISSLSGLFRGSGDIAAKYNLTDGLTLNGLYNVNYGQCSLSVQDIIRKNFSLLENSYVRFNGSPIDTEIDIRTYHNVNSASIYDLDPNLTRGNGVRVRCLMNISGNVREPVLDFDVDMPNGTAQEKDVLASATSTEEQRNLQFMYLLAIGRFYTYDYAQSTQGAQGPSAMESLVNSTVSGQINNLLSQVLDNEHITLSSNVSASSYLSNDATNLNNKELEGILEARLLDNRLLFNGNFGYRENTVNNTSDLIGDFEIKYKLLPRQGISIKGYNKTNDKYFSKTTLTTQGVGVVFEKDF